MTEVLVQTTKAYGGRTGRVNSFLTSASTSRPGRFNSRERISVQTEQEPQWAGRFCEKEETLARREIRTPDRPSRSPAIQAEKLLEVTNIKGKSEFISDYSTSQYTNRRSPQMQFTSKMTFEGLILWPHNLAKKCTVSLNKMANIQLSFKTETDRLL